MSEEHVPVRELGPSGEGRVLASGIGELLKYPLIDSRMAAAGALRAYLTSLTFTVWGGGIAADRTFQLRAVEREWPAPNTPLQPPMAVVLDGDTVKQDAFNLTPVPLEDTWDPECCTVLWKTAETVATLTADFWLGNAAERDAVVAALPGAFSPSEDRYGVFIETSSAYWSLPCRVTFVDSQRMDDPGSIYPNERRLSCTFKAEIAEVHMRRAVAMSVNTQIVATQDGQPVVTEPDAT